MRYISTRGGLAPQRFCDILLGGLAPDGGLVLPERYPHIDASTLAQWRTLSYPDLAYAIMRLYIDDIPAADLKRLIDATYREPVFGSADITPLTTLEPDLHLLGLSNGPTLAFKDIAMQFLGQVFEYVLAQRQQHLTILGATSGDTGSAAEYAMRGKQGIRVFMLSPYEKMSPFQTAQMFSLLDPNIYNVAIRGVFDDCQDIVKAVSRDPEFKACYHIGTVNSINWARVLAQLVYYFKGYFAATRHNEQQVSFSVPSGNFGNVCAGHIARMMGLPIRRLVVATNENDVLDVFFRTGRYQIRSEAETQHTSSPSMDISKASNFERFIFDLVQRDAAYVQALWQQVEREGGFDLAGSSAWSCMTQFGFVSGTSCHAQRIATIRECYARYNVMIDPHTADGLGVAQPWREAGIPMVCLETAQPAKFAATITEALDCEPPRPVALEGLEALPQRFQVMAPDVGALQAFIAVESTI